MQGYIKLHRQLIEWEWYNDINVKVLFLHCLLRANHQDKKWQGILIPKGSFVSSLDNLAFETGLSKMQVRTAIEKLSLTHEITYKPTRCYSMIVINNWDRYQTDNIQNNTPITHKQHTYNTPITLNNNDKNDNNDKNEKNNIIGEVEILKNKIDPFGDPLIDKCFELYKDNCPELPKLMFERRNREVRELTAKVLNEIDKDLNIFEEICEKANRLKTIVDKPIDYKKMLRCYQQILNGSYEEEKPASIDDEVKRILAICDANKEERG